MTALTAKMGETRIEKLMAEILELWPDGFYIERDMLAAMLPQSQYQVGLNGDTMCHQHCATILDGLKAVLSQLKRPYRVVRQDDSSGRSIEGGRFDTRDKAHEYIESAREHDTDGRYRVLPI